MSQQLGDNRPLGDKHDAMNQQVRDTESTRRARQTMVERQVVRRGIRNPAVLDAMNTVLRHAFVPAEMSDASYEDRPLPIGNEQTISQPYIVAYMTELLELTPTDRVLEIGTGSGYAAAVLAEIVSSVFTIERHEALAKDAQKMLEQLGYDNVDVRVGDGTRGSPQSAPFDAIVATAAGPEVPNTLKQQLAIGGRLVLPVGPRMSQELLRVRRIDEDEWATERLAGVRFVPLIGAEGWDE